MTHQSHPPSHSIERRASPISSQLVVRCAWTNPPESSERIAHRSTLQQTIGLENFSPLHAHFARTQRCASLTFSVAAGSLQSAQGNLHEEIQLRNQCWAPFSVKGPKVAPKGPRTRWRQKTLKKENYNHVTTTNKCRNVNPQIVHKWKSKLNPMIMSHTQD